MRRRKKDRQKQMISDLNLTNLIDVVFALLIIFMITAPMMTQGIQVDLPETESEAMETNELIEITINEHRQIFIDEELVAPIDFSKRFKEAFAGRTDVPVYVNADKEIPYGFFVRVVSEIQNAGVVKLGFLTAPLTDASGGF